MDIHDNIINLQIKIPEGIQGNEKLMLWYKAGHRDARHAAAELSIQIAQELEDLKNENRMLRATLEEYQSGDDDLHDEGQIPAGYSLVPTDSIEVIVTPLMEEAGIAASSDHYDANIIQSMGGLGGCKTMEQATPEVARYFGCEKPSVQVFFEAMDAHSPDPYGKEVTPEMIKAGQDMMARLFDAAMLKSTVKENPSALRALINSNDAPVSIAYKAMRTAAKA